MKVTVIKESVIHEQKIYKIGESFDLDDKVAISLLERGYVSIEGGEEVADALANAGVETMSFPFERSELELMEYKDLVQLAKDCGVKASGKKDEIIERLLEVHADEEELADELPNTGMPE